MGKWILASAAAALIAAFVLWQRGATKEVYVNGLAPYEGIPDHWYIFERDCYIFKLKSRDSDYPYVGDHAVVPALPAKVGASRIGADLPGVRILGLTRVGDRFRIVSVRRDTRRGRSTITFEILFADENEWKYPRLDAFWIMDHSPEARGEAPTLLPAYAAAEIAH